MNCGNVEQVISDLAREQMMDASVQTSALRHIEVCRRCETRLAEERHLTDVLRRYVSETSEAGASTDVELKLREEFRANRSCGVVQTSNKQRLFYAAAAAAVLLAIAIGVALRFRENDPTPVAQGVAVFPVSSEPASEPVDVSPEPVIRNQRPQRKQRRSPLRRTTLNPTVKVNFEASKLEVEVPTAFMPIGYSSAAMAQEGGQLVRVEMSRSAMARFGLPVNMERYDEHVKADVWFGPDGLARAIRFVQ